MKSKFLKRIGAFTCAFIMMGNTAWASTTGTVTGSRVNVRSQATTTSAVVDLKVAGEQVQILSREGDWYKIQLAGGEAYMFAQYVRENPEAPAAAAPAAQAAPAAAAAPVVEAPAAPAVQHVAINTMVLNMRQAPSLYAGIVGKLNMGQTVTVLADAGDWYQVKTAAGATGYIYKQHTTATTAPAADATDMRSKVIAFALAQVGTPYRYGGTSLTAGVDCSGFTQQVLRQFGIAINRSSRDQSKNGTAVSYSSIKPGDLIFYGSSSVISHVAMYIGNGQIVHASTPRTGVTISPAGSVGGKRIIACRSVLN
ncbi:C40 family peptidase [Anaerotalea alkaliphila]|uniref:C40 family peptidase n=1 Tax=Anaerotalea alkaliphila TaxID=2662126 RepID=A0A7X5HVF1_9FIRM|nr:C40 family peptidase [Anaerotalea alkaliphila]NDL67350.1 C40 family peptidase [Anaerotalea alkaliphila]